MKEISVTADDVYISGGKIIITLVQYFNFDEIFLKQRRTNKEIPCEYNVIGTKVFVTIKGSMQRGRYDFFIKHKGNNIRILLPSILKKDIPERYSLITKNDKNLIFGYFTLDGHLAVHVVNKDNNGHFNQFSGKMTVSDVFSNYPDKVVLRFRTSHIFNNLKVYLMELISNNKEQIPFSLKDNDLIINYATLNSKIPKLIVIQYEYQGAFQSRWVDFTKWVKKSLHNIQLRALSINKEGELKFKFCLESSVPIKGLELIVRNRETREEVKSIAIKSKNNSLVQCQMDANLFPIISSADSEILTETYDGNIFDFLVRPVFEWIPCVNYRMRIDYNDQLDDEFWFDKSPKIKQLVMMYKTTIGKLAARFAYLPQNSFTQYKLLLNKKIYEHDRIEKNILLVSEYINKAQDTGLAFFKYMIDNHKDDFETYYIITEHSKDLANLKNYMDNVIFFRSVEHINIVWRANYLAHSHSSIYAFPFNSKKMNELRLNMHKVFLQHGIMGVRDLGYLYQNDPLFTNQIIVSSNREKRIAEKNLNYTPEQIAITGLSRFDRLMKYRTSNNSKLVKHKILIMPSWRKGQNQLTDEEFMHTKFYIEWQALITDPYFGKIIKENNLSVDVYLHHNFQQYQHLFSSSYVNFIDEGIVSVQDLLIGHGLLITDFSSVGLDFSLLDRPILYFNFDDLFDFKELERIHFLPGEIIEDRSKLIKKIRDYLKFSKLKFKYKLYRKKNIYKFSDQNANSRIFNSLKGL
ncbi:CDP-glycerol glycerophosphotransferase family protein [Weissella paramesenteroides]|uniref:CDP-glycerol glycerophosphotransferase family protein n=1 Tax=Weissella paramesenteroides TaxID=1249 RepID=UPI003857EF25